MHVLPTDECYRLLSTHELGRLGFNAEHYPLIFPVNYALAGTTLVIRTASDTILRAAGARERDLPGGRHRPGGPAAAGACWSAVRPRRSARSTASSWWPGRSRPASSRGRRERRGTGCGSSRTTSPGRRIVPGELPPAVDPRAYL